MINERAPLAPTPPRTTSTPLWLRRAVVASLLVALVLAGALVMLPFMTAIAWAGILTYVSWPLYTRTLRGFGGRRNWAALVLSLVLTLILGGALLWLGLLLRNEGMIAVRAAASLLQSGAELPDWVRRVPWLGPWLQERLAGLGDRTSWSRELAQLAEQWGLDALRLVGDLGRNALRFGAALLISFFLFRDGERMVGQLRTVLQGLLGDRVQDYFDAVGDTTRAVVYGLLLAAIAQGLFAAIGYWVAGVKAPAFWGAATAVIALIPFGAPLVWGSIGIWLLLQDQVAAGIGLLVYGALVISQIDNLVRPLVISGVANVPFLLVLFGVLGGLSAFGLIGLFIGPVILAVLLALWREWVADNARHR